MIKKSLLKIVFSLIIIGFSLSGLLSIGQTYAFFSDSVGSNGNIFTAGILDLSLRSGQSNFVSDAQNMQPGNQVNRDIYIGKTSISSPLKYKVSYELIGGNENFCNQLQLKIQYDHYFDLPSGGYDNRDMRLKYDGPLTSLVDLTNEDFIIPHSDDQFDIDPNDGTEQWFYYSIILPSTIADIYQGQVCNFNFVVKAWQDNIGDYGDGGFTDVEELENTIKAGYWDPPVVLNEFLPNAGSFSEFVELYNNISSPIDLNGFYIMANNNRISINTITTSAYSSSSTTIPLNGWLVVTTGENLIDDSSGTITLYNPNDVEVDSYSYDVSDYYILEPTPGDLNDKTPTGSLPTEIPVDKSYARIPDGSSDWVDPIPTPGSPNKLDEKEVEELQLEEVIKELPLITTTTATSTIPDIDILENSSTTSTIIPDQVTITEPPINGSTTTTTTIPDSTTTTTIPEETITTTTIPEETTTTTTTITIEPPASPATTTTTTIPEETTTTTQPLVEETTATTTTTTTTILDSTTTTTIPPVSSTTSTITTTTIPDNTTTTTTEPPIEEITTTTTTTATTVPPSPHVTNTTTTTEPPVSTNSELDDSVVINLINIYFV